MQSDDPSRLTRRALGRGLIGAGIASLAPRIAFAQSAPPLATRQAAIDAIVADVMRTAGYPGMVVGIESGGETVTKGYGRADVERELPMTADSVLPIGSVTKSMTALAIMQLVDAGRIDVDAPLGRYLEDYAGPAREIRLRHLLNHTSGIPNYTSDPDFPKDNQRPMTHQAVIDVVRARPLQFAPGSRFSYSNTNTYLLGMIVERVSGASYGDYLQRHVFGPFGMRDSRLGDYRAIVPRRSRGYALNGQTLRNADQYDVSYPFSAGAVLSTAEDLLRYRRGVFGDATPASVRARLLHCDPLSDGTPLFYALGCLVVGRFEGHRRISHAGDIAGFASHYAYFPDDGLTIVLLTNLEHAFIAPYAIARKIARAALGIPQPQIRDLPVPPALLARLAADFDVAPIEFGVPRYGFLAQQGKLAMKFGGAAQEGPAIPLLYQGGGRFVTALDTEFGFHFEPDGRRLTAEFYDGTFTARRIG